MKDNFSAECTCGEDRICTHCYDPDEYDLTDCPKNCGELTVCRHCTVYEGRKCQRCEQDFQNGEPPEHDEIKHPLTGTKNWAFSRDAEWDYKCLHCGQLHVEWTQPVEGGFLIPVDTDGNSIECIRFPVIENDVCESCGKEVHIVNHHGKDCLYWKAYQQLNKVKENDT